MSSKISILSKGMYPIFNSKEVLSVFEGMDQRIPLVPRFGLEGASVNL
jgi:hypothetical protein